MKNLLFLLMLMVIIGLAGCNFGGDSSNESSTEDTIENSSENTGTVGEETSGKVINLTSDGDIPTLDSAHAHDGIAFTVLNNVNEGLYRGDDAHNPELAMAEDHQVSEDGLVHTFLIRDAQWSNGEAVTANDFEYAWKRVFEEVGHYNVMFETAGIKNASAIIAGDMTPDDLGIVALDEKTLEITVENPSALLNQLLTFPIFLPLNQAHVEEVGDTFGTEAETILSNGPFLLDSWQQDQGWVYKKNPDYWDAETVSLDQINVNVVKEVSTAVNLWESDAVDRITISSSYVDEYENDENFANVVRPEVIFMRFNHNHEHFANENIRKAIDMTIDKEGLTNTILNNGSVPLYSLVPQEFSYSPNEEVDFRELNGEFNQGSVEEAIALWEDGLSEIDSDGFEMSLMSSDDDNHVKSAEFIKNQLESNLEGITVNIKTVPFEARLENEKAVEYDMVISSWGPDYSDPMTYIDMWVTDGPANRMDFSDDEFDSIVAEANVETDAEVRYQLLLDAEKKLMDEMHIAPLYQSADALLTRSKIKGIVRHPSAPEYEYKWADVE
ncbi:peptide ABC transporter substrate-binding protein [Salipaludibacillus neizhouensis]|uniref:Peptide ABC transporter substrate-binding protein n=1 Tax=Salipaludibacillus neizhouensis TaxID=885475 RepID=A0A3A9K7N5_9BACI|nr:peptide ABC transporter substrate-binding protein [Salipaludibacillus neizhouensis]RKL66850.1 peptide ABC transporter substrate-binding protein [Salipaludibacillus neizhouensis]